VLLEESDLATLPLLNYASTNVPDEAPIMTARSTLPIRCRKPGTLARRLFHFHWPRFVDSLGKQVASTLLQCMSCMASSPYLLCNLSLHEKHRGGTPAISKKKKEDGDNSVDNSCTESARRLSSVRGLRAL